ncbi:tetratricopeptide repeat protein [Anaerolineales bacterium HSG24]|nr:tetratricopeptide repeat protein [Anaerolineales bacterium HSG24]
MLGYSCRWAINLYQLNPDQPFSELLTDLSHHADTKFLLLRVFQRLAQYPTQYEILAQLSVYRQAIPDTFWAGETTTINHLQQRRLIQVDQFQWISLLPAYQQIIYDALSENSRQIFHEQAAYHRANLMQYTSSAYHLINAGQPNQAIEQSYINIQFEIEQGRGSTIMSLLQEIATDQLTAKNKDNRYYILAKLEQLSGNYDKTLELLRMPIRHSPILKALVGRIKGDIFDERGKYQEAYREYQEGLQTVENLLNEVVIFQRGLSWTSHRQDKETAWVESEKGRCEIDNLQGYLQMRRENYDLAKKLLSQALSKAKELNYPMGQAKAHDNLGQIYTLQNFFSEAIEHLKMSRKLYTEIGYQSRIVNLNMNMAWNYLLAEEFEPVIELCTPALEAYQKIGHQEGEAMCCINLADAYLGLDDSNQAIYYASQAQEIEAVRDDALRILGLALARQGDFVEGEKHLQMALDFCQSNEMQAWIWRDYMELYLRQNNMDQAISARDKAINLFTELGQSNEIKKTEARYTSVSS